MDVRIYEFVIPTLIAMLAVSTTAGLLATVTLAAQKCCRQDPIQRRALRDAIAGRAA
jgi:hypothetical protein